MLTHTTPYPADYVTTVTLNDGSEVKLRPIRPSDAPLLQESFSRLSAETIYLRFLEMLRQLTDEQARQFAQVNYHTHMAMVGEIQEAGGPRLVAVARYALVDGEQPGVAEAAIVVRDDYQRRGLGTHTMAHLVKYARANGVSCFQATIHMSNLGIKRFIQKSGLPFEQKMLEPGTWIIRVWLDGEKPGAA